jgi:hypothetical protein
MATHSDDPITRDEDAAFDSTMKIAGGVLALMAIGVAALWYF